MPEKKSPAESAGKKSKSTKKTAKKTPAAKATKKKAPKGPRVARLNNDAIVAKRAELKAKLFAGPMSPAAMKSELGLNAGQLRKVLADAAFEKIGKSGPSVKYKLAG